MGHFFLVLIIVLYFGTLVLIGLFSRKESDSVEGYYTAGRGLRYWIVSISINAAGESGWLLLGLTGMGYAVGAHALWVVLGETLGIAISWIYMARRFKVYTDKYKSVTMPDFLEERFDDKKHIIRIISSVILIIMITSYIAAQLTATGKTFKSFLHVDFMTGTLIGLVIIIFYTVIGGLKAVARADFFQGIIMFFGLIALPVVSIINTGGFSNMFSSLRTIDPKLLDVFGPSGISFASFISIIGFLAIGWAFMGSPQLYIRFIATKSQTDLIYGKYVAILFIIIIDIGAVLTGMAGRVLFPSLVDQEFVMPTVSMELFPSYVAGVFIAIVLAAIISTVDALLILLSSVLTRDVYQKIINPDASQKRLIFYGRLIVVIVGFTAFWFSLSESKLIFWFVLFAWSGIGCAFCPVVILSIFWKRMTRAGAIAGMVSGFLITVIWAKLFKNSTGLYEMVPGFIGGMLAIVLVSLFTKPPQKAEEEIQYVKQTVKNYKV